MEMSPATGLPLQCSDDSQEMDMMTLKRLKRRGGLFAVAVTTLTIAVPALAGGSAGPDVTVRFQDLNIQTVEGATVLLNRINTAAHNVCARLDHGDLASHANLVRCQQKLTAAAVARVNNPVLATVYKSAHPTTSTVAALVR
jgi:UrcA family protein